MLTKFSKMHGLGNDFVVVDCLGQPEVEEKAVARASWLCDRHFGIGADGIILILPSEVAEARMRIINADGSEAEMCGNGIRCFAKYVYERGLFKGEELAVETLSGIVRPRVEVEDGMVRGVAVNIGQPRLERGEIPMLGAGGRVIGESLETEDGRVVATCLSMGNPHCVVFVEDVENYPIARQGGLLERHPAFPQRTNVEFVRVESEDELEIRVWERGVGETLACGTGACAAVVAGVLNQRAGRKVKVGLRGGELLVHWLEDNDVLLSGPASYVFGGEIEL